MVCWIFLWFRRQERRREKPLSSILPMTKWTRSFMRTSSPPSRWSRNSANSTKSRNRAFFRR
jgi:hypothetical protein